jgi:hypothetical protein
MKSTQSTGAGINSMANNVGMSLSEDPTKVTYGEMRLVALELNRLEVRGKRIRTCAMIIIGFISVTALFAGGIAVLVSAFKKTEVRDQPSGLILTKKETQKIIATSQSTEDIDGSDLIDYGRNLIDDNGDPDGAWTLSNDRIALIRSLSWRSDDTDPSSPSYGQKKTEVHHVAEIERHDGPQAHVKIVTKAKHIIKIWDNTGGDNFDVKIFRYNRATGGYFPEEEISANGDEADGRGRVLVSLSRPRLQTRPRAINADDYWD